MTDNAQAVIECIEHAFADVRLEDGVSLREANVIDDYETIDNYYGTADERIKARSRDELHDWKRISDELIDRNYSCLVFFDGKGLRFHLPAYMCFTLRHLGSGSPVYSYLVGSLGYSRLHDLLTPPQREAVRQFLKFMAFKVGIAVDQHAKRILEDYWWMELE